MIYIDYPKIILLEIPVITKKNIIDNVVIATLGPTSSTFLTSTLSPMPTMEIRNRNLLILLIKSACELLIISKFRKIKSSINPITNQGIYKNKDWKKLLGEFLSFSKVSLRKNKLIIITSGPSKITRVNFTNVAVEAESWLTTAEAATT